MTAPVTQNAIDVVGELTRARARTLDLCDYLTEDQQQEQVSPIMSPAVWDLAHVGNFEELWLLRAIDGRPAISDELDDLYNAFEHPRWERPSLPLLSPVDSRSYMADVRAQALDLLGRVDLEMVPADPEDRVRRLLHRGAVYAMVIQHEHQHAETLLGTHQLRGEAAITPPGARLSGIAEVPAEGPAARLAPAGSTGLSGEVHVAGGSFTMGASDDPWAYDNERAAHTVDVEPFYMDRSPVTNRRFLEFVQDGGYGSPLLWAQEGRDWRAGNEPHPAFWAPADTEIGFTVLRFGRHIDLDDILDDPVQHVCWYEADAFARWCGRRLPTEAEWEKAATWDPVAGIKRSYPWGNEPPTDRHANLGQALDGPCAAGSRPLGASPHGCLAMIGDVWEWTSSDFRPYPDFEPFPYKGYSQVFWGADFKVLRGGSWATDPVAVRGTFRNWDFPIRRQIFAGFRCARDT